MTVSAADVLATLDRAAETFALPMLDNGYVYPAAARLSLFRSATDWAMVFETMGYSPRSGWPDLCVTTVGSSVRHNPIAGYDEQTFRDHVTANPGVASDYFHPFDRDAWLDPDDEWSVNPAASRFLLRGRTLPVPTAPDYAAAGVTLAEPPRVQVYEFVRAVAHAYRDLVLATEAERAAALPGPMDRLLTLDDWHHPDLAGSVPPSDEPDFRALAAVLETGDPGRHRPTQAGNTHWFNWPDGGSL